MPEDFETIAPRVAQLIRLLASDSDGEVLAAVSATRRTLTNAGLDIHALAERVEHGGGDPLHEDEMRAIWNQAEAYGRQCAEAEHAAERPAVEPEPSAIFTSVRTVERPTEPGVNGYSWQQIAEHCANNKHLFSGKSLEFVENLPEKLSYFGSPTLKQANWLRDLFMTRCRGRID